jgi:hypothetical protein
LPNQNPKLRYETVRRSVFIPKPHEKLCKEIEYFATKLFTEIIKHYATYVLSILRLDSLNSALKSSFDFNPQMIFDLLSCGCGHITADSLKQFVGQNGGSLSDDEIGCLIKTIDKKGIARISRDDFDNFIATMGLRKGH